MAIKLEDGVDQEEAIFRSAPMLMVQFYVTNELARDVVFSLGKIGNVHFRDLNSKLTPFQRTFLDDLRAIDSLELDLHYLETVMNKHQVIRGDLYRNLTADLAPLASVSETDDLKVQVSNVYAKIKHLDDSYHNLELNRDKLIENRAVIDAVNDFHTTRTENAPERISEDVGLLRDQEINIGLETEDFQEDTGFSAIAGTINSEKVPLLRKIIWRSLRGNLYFYDSDILGSEKSVFIIYVHGEMVKQRVRRIVGSLDGVIFDNIYGGRSARNESLQELNQQLDDVEKVAQSTKDHLITELMILQESFANWRYTTKRERMIYETLNKFDMDGTRRCLVGEGWIPTSEFQRVRQTLNNVIRLKTRDPAANEEIPLDDNSLFTVDETFEDLGQDSEDLVAVVNELATNRIPPTYHKTNKLTQAFQSIVDAYGIATYQEVNPGLATIITFPFMFAIMFGDIGHGVIVLLISLYLVKNERRFGEMRNRDEVFDMAFSGRYVLLLMGAFSIYTGFLYNDIFSKSLTFFKSGWTFEGVGKGTVVAKRIKDYVYPIGLDWAWHGSENNLLFTNSYKMKLSVLMGFIHMNYSLMFSLVNYRFFKSRVDIIGNFIPGFLFMQSIFGYLSICIIYKWTVDWVQVDKQPPGLLNMLINMFLAPGKIEEQLYPGQKFVQIVLVLIALVCVPWLLLYKPITLNNQNKRAQKLGYSDLHSQLNHDSQLHAEEQALEDALSFEITSDNESQNSEFHFPNDIEPLHNAAGHDGGDGFEIGDVIIHQVIHTIEFCLNCVSHTASYLRLWALSLAHAQLSSVLWTMTIQNAFGVTGTKGVVMTVLLFGFWFVLTVCILVLMEGTSAMLHSLRLHWVEAMSKFFVGEGYAYDPFTFSSIDL